MKKITLYISLIFLNACQPVQSIAAQQQNFVCKALIEGYLKAQQFNNFELRKEKREELNSTDQITYLYWQATLRAYPEYFLCKIKLKKAKLTNCRLVFRYLSQFFQSLLHFSNQANDLSTTQR